ncbi:hypothetical protein [Nitrosomonas sp. Is37]|uniref:hypothetical protein n=1 Tax=Nitrosomonas sp. Is37 TaxID=3080535 RepID=UPI00294B37B5|nr:hypothetical protein [Nitrosomonas sp. Is37]MDV6345243.1 hypothetical protein [Nitrosomonas sp. Is37]
MTDGFDKLKANELPSHKDDKIQALEKKVVELEDRLLEERFYWALGVVILIDIFSFPPMKSWGGPVAIVFLELFGLVVLAQKCGVDIIVQIIDKIIDGWSQNNSK